MRRWTLAAAAVGLIGSAAPAGAAWMRATTAHFVIFQDGSESQLRQRATELEQFDHVIGDVFGHQPNPDAAENIITVYVVSSEAAVQRLCGGGRACQNVAGFYLPRVTGSVAFTPASGSGDGSLDPRIVLFHEYGHHFLFGNYAMAYPGWFSEGFAEFVSTTKIDRKGAQVGGPALHRAWDLLSPDRMSARALFAADARKLRPEAIQQVYARGWLLTHLILFDHERRTQFNRYLTLLNTGTPSLDAAGKAFGDLSALDRQLDRYLMAPTIPVWTRTPEQLPQVKVDVAPLTPTERALIGDRIQSDRGVDSRTSGPLWAKAKPLAGAAQNDPLALGWLAEMASDAGDDDGAEAAADRALALDPKSTQALLYKGRARLHRALAAKAAPAVWTEARSWIIKANRIDNSNAEALALFYQSFLMADQTPSKSAALGLQRASELVPEDEGIRFLLARQDVLDGNVADARIALRPLANDPHAGPDNAAQQLLAILAGGAKGQAALDAFDAAMKAREKGAAKS